MQPDLQTLQAHFRQAVLTDIDQSGAEPGSPSQLLAAINDAGIPAERRLAIHRNHFATTLTEGLGGIFEATRALLGPDFFDAFARRFVRTHPPAEPSLFRYGSAFPAALASAPGLSDYGYVIDVALLEWAMHESFHASAAPKLEATRLTALPADQISNAVLQPHPTVRLIQAAFPVDALWQGARDNAVDDAMLAGDPAFLLLSRPELDVEMVPLAAPGFAFLAALFDGQTIAGAAGEAMEVGAFDLGEVLGACLAQTVFADIVTTEQL